MKLLISLSALLLPLMLQGAERTHTQMTRVAHEAIRSHCNLRARVLEQEPVCLTSRQGVAVYGYHEGGFAVVSTSDLLPEVLGLSSSSYDEAEANPNFSWWLEATTQAAAYCMEHGVAPQRTRPSGNNRPAHVLPLMSSAWGQEKPFSDLCPMVYNAERTPVHSLVGCVATALSQIFYYHKSAGTPQGSATVGVPHDHPLQYYTVDFAQLDYDWNQMLDTYTVGNYTQEQAHAVAELCYTVGVACDMMYDYTASGTMSNVTALAMKRNFGLPESCRLVTRDEYSENPSGWMNLVFGELANDRPIFYTGSDFPAGGHAFVLDGYDEEGRVHVNWGWCGRQDGYYNIDLLNPGSYNFRIGQDMIIGIQPNPAPQLSSLSVSVPQAGALGSMLTDVEHLGELTITGQLGEDDFLALRQCPSLQRLDLGQVTLATQEQELPAHALRGCGSLRRLVLPRTMCSWGDGALAGCSSLNEIVLPQGDADCRYVVSGDLVYSADRSELIAVLPTCVGTVEVPMGVTAVHAHAFEGCKRVRNVYLPASLQSLGDRAMTDVTVMRELHIAAPEPPQVGVQTFDGVDPGFAHLYIPAGLRDEYQHAAGWSQLFASGCVAEEGLTLRARNATRRVGDPNPYLAYEAWGNTLYGGEPQLTCEATPQSPAGRYPIVIERGTVDAPDVTLCNGWLVVEEDSSQAPSATAAIGHPSSAPAKIIDRTDAVGTRRSTSGGVQVVRYDDGTVVKAIVVN